MQKAAESRYPTRAAIDIIAPGNPGVSHKANPAQPTYTARNLEPLYLADSPRNVPSRAGIRVIFSWNDQDRYPAQVICPISQVPSLHLIATKIWHQLIALPNRSPNRSNTFARPIVTKSLDHRIAHPAADRYSTTNLLPIFSQ